MRCLAVTIALILILQPTPLRTQQRACEPARNPKQLPAVGALVDSAGAITGLATIDAPEGMLFSLALLEGDSLPVVKPLFGTDATAAGILASWIRPQKRSNETWAVRMRAAGGPAPSLRVERAVYCPPVFIPGLQTGVSTITVHALTEDRAARFEGPPGQVIVIALVSEVGAPARVNVIQSSGIPEFDAQFLEGWQHARFQPALLDGLPVQAWYRSDQPRPQLPTPPPADDDSVYLESEVEEKPQMSSMARLTYPDRLREGGTEGRVVVQAIIDKKGRVEPQSVQVIETSNEGFNKPAINVVRQSRFRPGTIQGRAVRVRVNLPIAFTIQD